MREKTARTIERVILVGLLALATNCGGEAVDEFGFDDGLGDGYDVTGNEPVDPDLEQLTSALTIGTDNTFTSGWGDLLLYNCTRNSAGTCHITTGIGSTAPTYSGNYGRFRKSAGSSSSAVTIMVEPVYKLPP